MRTNVFMNSKDLRAEVRIPVIQRGTLSFEDIWLPCLVENMSEHGNFIFSNRELPVGQVLELRFELFPGQFLNCKLEVTRANGTSLGTKIVEIDKSGIKLCQLFLQEQYADKLDKFG